MRKKNPNMVTWLMASLMIMFSARAYAVNEKEYIDIQKLLTTTDVTLYIKYGGRSADKNEENFFKRSCIYKSADRNEVIALLRIINFSSFEKNVSIMARPDWSEANQDVWKSSSYAVKFNFPDNTSAWLMLESEFREGPMDGYYTYLPDYDRFPIIGPDLLGTSLRLWIQLLKTQPQVAPNSINTVEQCDEIITNSVFRK